MKLIKNLIFFIVLSCFHILTSSSGCHKNTSINAGNGNQLPPIDNNDVDFWLTKGDQSALLQKQSAIPSFDTVKNSFSFINVDTTQVFQTIDGFGYTLTGGSAHLINSLNASDKTNLLRELFGNDSNSISISYLRISIGASDLDASVFSYDDMPPGQIDTNLNNFSLDPDRTDVIPLLKEILLINPSIKI